jgi:hypothetical protein
MARMRLLSVFFLAAGAFVLAAGAWAQPAIAPPQIGFIEDGARALRPAYGLAGNFILGPAVASNIVTVAFSGSIGLLKTDSLLAAFDSQGKVLASMDAAPGPALFAFSPGATALAYIASSNALFEWLGSAFAPVSLNNQEADTQDVLAIAFPTPSEASLFVQENDTIWELHLPLGNWGDVSRNALAGVHGPLLALPAGDLLYHGTGGIVVRRTDGSEVPIAASLPARFSLQQMNRDWVQLTDLAGGPRFAIRTTPGREALYQLPERTK